MCSRISAVQAAAWLREHRPQVGVVVLSQYTAPGYAVALLEHAEALRQLWQGRDSGAFASL